MRHKPSRLCLGVAKLILLVELCKSLSYFLLYGYFCLEGRGEFTHFAHCDFRIFRKGTNFCWISLSGCLKIGGYYTPKAGFQFDKWSDGNTQASRSLTIDKAYTLVASFKVAEAGGEDTGNTGGGSSDTPTDFM